MRRTPLLLLVLAGGGAAVAPACSDPVRDDAVEALGGEVEGVPPGPEHRPGQPCVLCHSRGGPASSKPFAVAGTIFKSEAFDSPGAENITVQFVDASNGAPRVLPTTNAAGNFFVREEEWPDLTFPVRVGIYQDASKPPTQTMKSLVNREGSCNFCHRPNPNPSSITNEEKKASKSSAGQIYLTSGTAK